MVAVGRDRRSLTGPDPLARQTRTFPPAADSEEFPVRAGGSQTRRRSDSPRIPEKTTSGSASDTTGPVDDTAASAVCTLCVGRAAGDGPATASSGDRTKPARALEDRFPKVHKYWRDVTRNGDCPDEKVGGQPPGPVFTRQELALRCLRSAISVFHLLEV